MGMGILLTLSSIPVNNFSIFALEVAQQFPAAKVTGLDISPANYPSDWTWPENVSFGLWNVFTPPPEQYCNRFDVVHVRLLTGAAIGKDKHYLLRNLIKLLSESSIWTCPIKS